MNNFTLLVSSLPMIVLLRCLSPPFHPPVLLFTCSPLLFCQPCALSPTYETPENSSSSLSSHHTFLVRAHATDTSYFDFFEKPAEGLFFFTVLAVPALRKTPFPLCTRPIVSPPLPDFLIQESGGVAFLFGRSQL